VVRVHPVAAPVDRWAVTVVTAQHGTAHLTPVAGVVVARLAALVVRVAAGIGAWLERQTRVVAAVPVWLPILTLVRMAALVL